MQVQPDRIQVHIRVIHTFGAIDQRAKGQRRASLGQPNPQIGFMCSDLSFEINADPISGMEFVGKGEGFGSEGGVTTGGSRGCLGGKWDLM